ncbi:hypothetical protein FA95DRAFT_1561345 [Auriscalpium vulgare]|uniref:Uncharacterized protein n=1 Tax=Auriscalpium vulgare TaxID=40419 RepID=A0ACB8RML3_9AGAM|nr:hypothetical protein FA95DRAFT_1561345 [Auriscalpium vulgare]
MERAAVSALASPARPYSRSILPAVLAFCAPHPRSNERRRIDTAAWRSSKGRSERRTSHLLLSPCIRFDEDVAWRWDCKETTR